MVSQKPRTSLNRRGQGPQTPVFAAPFANSALHILCEVIEGWLKSGVFGGLGGIPGLLADPAASRDSRDGQPIEADPRYYTHLGFASPSDLSRHTLFTTAAPNGKRPEPFRPRHASRTASCQHCSSDDPHSGHVRMPSTPVIRSPQTSERPDPGGGRPWLVRLPPDFWVFPSANPFNPPSIAV